MKQLINEFWIWANRSPEQYSEDGCLNQEKGEFEEDFPYFEDMFCLGKSVIYNNILDDDILNDFLTVMAINNEGEFLSDLLIDIGTEEQINKVIDLGMKHPQSSARWQITKVLYKRRPDGWLDFLKKLTQDSNEYVRRRARNTLNYFLLGEKWDIYLSNMFAGKKIVKKTIDKSTAVCEICKSELIKTTVYQSENSEYCICKQCYTDCSALFGWFKFEL